MAHTIRTWGWRATPRLANPGDTGNSLPVTQARGLCRTAAWHPHRFSQEMPPRRAVWPILRMLYQSCLDRIIVHILQLLSCFSLRIHVEHIVLRLPHRTLQVSHFRIGRQTIPVQSFELDRGAPFPLIHEETQSTLFIEAHQGMNMFRHHHETKTSALLVNQLHAKEVDDDALGLVVIQRCSTFVTGESRETGMPFPIKDPSSHPPGSLSPTQAGAGLLPYGHWQRVASATLQSASVRCWVRNEASFAVTTINTSR